MSINIAKKSAIIANNAPRCAGSFAYYDAILKQKLQQDASAFVAAFWDITVFNYIYCFTLSGISSRGIETVITTLMSASSASLAVSRTNFSKSAIFLLQIL